jgi:predicted nucleotidyltransferase
MRVLERTNSLMNAEANDVVGATINVSGMRQASMQVSGTFVGEVTVEASQCGDVWFEIYGRDYSDNSHAIAKKIDAPGLIVIENLCGIQFLRAKTTAYTSGAIMACFAAVG